MCVRWLQYLQDTLLEFIRGVLETTEDCEVDPMRVPNNTTLHRHQNNLKRHCHVAWRKIIYSHTYFPMYVVVVVIVVVVVVVVVIAAAVVGRGRALDSRLREPGFESCGVKAMATFFTLYCSSSLSCINEYLAIDSGDYVCEYPFTH